MSNLSLNSRLARVLRALLDNQPDILQSPDVELWLPRYENLISRAQTDTTQELTDELLAALDDASGVQ